MASMVSSYFPFLLFTVLIVITLLQQQLKANLWFNMSVIKNNIGTRSKGMMMVQDANNYTCPKTMSHVSLNSSFWHINFDKSTTFLDKSG